MAILASIVAALGVRVFVPATKKKEPPAPPPIPVVVAAAERRDVPVYLDGLGNVVASQTVTVKPQVDGRLEKIFFREGQDVKPGEILALIDPRPFEAQLAQARGARQRDASQLEDAKRNLERNIELGHRNLIAQQQVDTQRALVLQLEGDVAIDEAQIKNAELNLEYAHIRAPIAGRTGIRLVDAGNIVHASDATGIVILTALDPINIVFTLPEDTLPRIAEQMTKAKLGVEAMSREGDVGLAKGELLFVDNQINQTTGTIRLKAIFNNPQHLLWPNQFVKARLHLETQDDVLTIPASAVERGPEGSFVWLVSTSSTVSPRAIESASGASGSSGSGGSGELAVVKKGLDPGDRVVTDGQDRLSEGAHVAPKPPSKNERAPSAPKNEVSG